MTRCSAPARHRWPVEKRGEHLCFHDAHESVLPARGGAAASVFVRIPSISVCIGVFSLIFDVRMCWCCSSRRVRRCTENKPGQHRFRNGTSADRRRGWTKTGIVRGETRPELRLVSSNRPQRPQNKVHACRLISTARHAYIELCDCFAGRNAQSGEPSTSSTEVAPAPSPAPAASLRPSLQGAHYP